MLNAEEGRARLEAIADADWRGKAKARTDALPPELREAADPVLASDEVYRDPKEYQRWAQQLAAASEVLDELGGAARAELMTGLHPRLGPALARWWVEAMRQPYIPGRGRGFRAPRHPAITRRGRIDTLHRLLTALGPYAEDATWLAAWAPYLPGPWSASPLAGSPGGQLLAAAIDEGGATGETVFDTLLEVGQGEHPVGMMGQHVIVGLLRSARQDGWDFVGRLLLAAQRQEGLRQSILEVAHEGRPEAFDHVLGLVLDHDLLRFAAAIRAAGAWLGLEAGVEQTSEVRELLTVLRTVRVDAAALEAAFAEGDAWPTYVGLCGLAMTDVMEALDRARSIVAHRPQDARAAAMRFANATSLPVANADLGWGALGDDDLRVAWLGFEIIRYSGGGTDPPGAFEELERFASRLPEKDCALDPIGIDSSPLTVSREDVVTSLFRYRQDRPLARLLPWVPSMAPAVRGWMASAIGGAGDLLTPELREVVLAMVGDRSPAVRGAAVTALAKLHVAPADAPALEALLSRKAGDLRRGVIALLVSMPEDEVLRSADRLWNGDTAQRDAACEMLRELKERPAAIEAARRFAAAPTLSPRQAELLADVVGTPSGTATYADDPGLGLYQPGRRTPVSQPAPPEGRRSFVSDTACRIVGALDDVAEAHRDVTLVLRSWQGTRRMLLADAPWLPSPFSNTPPQDGEVESGLILPDVFRTWWADRPAELRDAGDELDALRALAALQVAGQLRGAGGWYHASEREWWFPLLERLGGGPVGEVRHFVMVHHVLSWMLAERVTGAAVDECLDAYSAAAAGVPAAAVRLLEPSDDPQRWSRSDFRHLVMHGQPWSGLLTGLHGIRPGLFDPARLGRWFRLARWFDEPVPGARRTPVDAGLLMRAFEAGEANDHDVLDGLIGGGGNLLPRLTRRRRSDVETSHPDVVAIADRVRERVLEIELGRGELATTASGVAFGLSSVSGVGVVTRLLAGLGRASLVRGAIARNEGRESVYSHLLRVSYPEPDETGLALRSSARAAGVPDLRLLDLAMFAPQWAELVEEAVGWPGLADGVWWFHAHTKDEQWAVAAEVRETWAALSAERTPLAADDLVAGAVDVAWFRRSRGALGEARWQHLHDVAKLASGGNGHRRAQLFAEAMSGHAGEAALVERIRAKRHQDSVRALGLVPVPDDPADRNATMLRRYGVLREFERGAAKFGSQRQASEKTAVRIAIENLARSGGMADPQRFVWAMEAAEAGELADGPVSVSTDTGVTVTLAVDGEGNAAVSVARGDRALKAVPPAAKKDPDVAALLARRTALDRQASRVRASLEAAMVNEDGFTADDLARLERHPVVAPMLALVVFADGDGRLVRRAAGGRFVNAEGEVVGTAGRTLRLAHPVDLLESGEWIAWQRQLFADEQRQPFKQVFRELYTLTETERAAGPASHRYEGHQVQPGQAAALLGRRGWLVDRENGEVARVFHAHRIAARLEFLDGFLTPAEVELPTIRTVAFTRPGRWVAETIETVPPIVFSEAMRDLDLVVSVAHAGGVDPEASHSTVEMRAALVRETARVLRLDNVRPVNSHVVIEGTLGEYSVHLGSGSVHRRPGGAVCIIPVDSQRRGRIFLPFADDDPKTAEVVAKVLLLARDRDIKDPTILSQLRS